MLIGLREGSPTPGFCPDRLDMGDLSTIWGASAGGQSINGGEGPNFDRLYDKLKVLSLLLTLLW